jgi:hypothetical protein
MLVAAVNRNRLLRTGYGRIAHCTAQCQLPIVGRRRVPAVRSRGPFALGGGELNPAGTVFRSLAGSCLDNGRQWPAPDH